MGADAKAFRTDHYAHQSSPCVDRSPGARAPSGDPLPEQMIAEEPTSQRVSLE
jgi:hypothetical protein